MKSNGNVPTAAVNCCCRHADFTNSNDSRSTSSCSLRVVLYETREATSLRNQIWSLDSRFVATRHTATSPGPGVCSSICMTRRKRSGYARLRSFVYFRSRPGNRKHELHWYETFMNVARAIPVTSRPLDRSNSRAWHIVEAYDRHSQPASQPYSLQIKSQFTPLCFEYVPPNFRRLNTTVGLVLYCEATSGLVPEWHSSVSLLLQVNLPLTLC